MKFFIDSVNSIPPHAQLRDQIKLAIALGRLRPGDMLPSVRDLEQELDMGKNTIWRVYQQLEKAGLVETRHGKGARVSANFALTGNKDKLERCEQLCSQTLQQVLRTKIHPASFLRYFQQYLIRSLGEGRQLIFTDCNRTETEVFSRQISELWAVDIQGILIDDLRTKLAQTAKARNTSILTNIYHLDEVRNALKGAAAEIIGMNFRWDRRMLKTIENLQESGTLLFVFEDPDKHHYGSLILKEFRSLVQGRRIALALKGISEVGDLRALCRSRKYSLILFSNRIWHRIPGDIKKLPVVARLTMQIDPSSLERARIQVGVIW